MCSHLHVPLVIIIKDVKGNAEKVADDLESLLKPFDISVCWVSGRKLWTAVHALAGSRFRQGKLVLVMSAHADDLSCLNEYLAEQRIAGEALLARFTCAASHLLQPFRLAPACQKPMGLTMLLAWLALLSRSYTAWLASAWPYSDTLCLPMKVSELLFASYRGHSLC